MSSDGAQATWALHLIGTLRAAGVSRAVVSPGSRSTPLVWALAQHDIAVITVVDERVAGFIALGASRADERPTLLVCTSGTAGAHYYPAVIEAEQCGIPLLVCTADRPPELQGNGSSQTINQTRLFGQFATFFDLGRPSAQPNAMAGLRRTATQAAAALAVGPAHINAPFAKPLEPPENWAHEPAAYPIAAAVHSASARCIDVDVAARWLQPLRACERLAVVAGPQRCGARALAPAVAELVQALGATLLAETASQWGAGTEAAGMATLDAHMQDPSLHPDGVLQLGPAPVSGDWGRWLAASDVPHVVVCERGYVDAQNTAVLVHTGDPLTATLPALLKAAQRDAHKNTFAKRRSFAEACASDNLNKARAAFAQSVPGIAAVAGVVSALPSDARLLIGNSLAIRDLDAASVIAAPQGPVMSQRGAAGIDGLVSGALGAAWATDAPVCVVLGDVSFAHDLGGLAALTQHAHTVVVVIIDNGGGRIFERLPVAHNPHTAPLMAQHWLTPIGWPIADVSEALGASVVRCDARAGEAQHVVEGATRAAFAAGRASVVHVTLDADEDRVARDARLR